MLRPEEDQRAYFSLYVEIVGVKLEQCAVDMPTLRELSFVSLGDDFGACLLFMYHSHNSFSLTDMANYHAMIHIAHESAYRGLFEHLP